MHDVTSLDVSRADSAAGWWELARRRPDPRLSTLVISLGGYRERSRVTVERTMPATSRIPLAISFGDRLEIDMAERGAAEFESFVAGFHPGPATTRYRGTQCGVQVNLTPLGAFRIFGVPGSALAHQVVHLGDAAPGFDVRSLGDRLAALPTWGSRFALIEELLLAMAAAGPEPDPMVDWMWGRLRSTRGQVSISALVAETGRSHRHVASRFRQQVGLTPKSTAGVIRFEHAAHLISSGGASLADAAARSGYADQSHLTREFVRMTGHAPTYHVRESAGHPGSSRLPLFAC